MAAAAAAAVAHLSIHGRLRRSPEHRPSITTTTTSSSSSSAHRPSLLRCRAFKQEAGDGDPAEADARKRRKGPLYKLKAAIQGLAGSRSAAAEVYGGEYQFQRAVENLCEPRFPNPLARAHRCGFLCCFHPRALFFFMEPWQEAATGDLARIWCLAAHISPSGRWSGLETTFLAAESICNVEVQSGHRCQLAPEPIPIP